MPVPPLARALVRLALSAGRLFKKSETLSERAAIVVDVED
jgi:hypothetical protein